MSKQTELESRPAGASLVDQIQATDRFTGVGVNVVVITLAVVALLPLLFDSRFWSLRGWQIGLTFLFWGLYILNGTRGMVIYDRCVDQGFAPYLFFGLQIAIMAALLFLTRATSGSVWILILPIAAQSLSRGWLFTSAVSLTLLGLIWIAYFLNQPWPETLIDLLSIGAALAFTLIFTNIAVRESSARSQVQQLAADLRQANHRLAAYATQVEELATMRERNRVAREIHDNLGHYLTVVNVQIAAAKTIMADNPDKAHDALNKAQALTQEGLAAVRRSVSALRESPLENQTIAEALATLVDESRAAGLETNLVIEGEPIDMDPKTALTLYRAVQEGLTNVRKHARATRADILLHYAPEGIKLSVVDNGRGAAVPHENSGSFGLIGIQERVHLLGGQMTIVTAPHEGFQFTITLPQTDS